MHSKRFLHQIYKFTSCNTFINSDVRYILEARKRALAKKKKLRSLGKRAQSADSEDEMEVDGESDIRAHICHEYHELYSCRKKLPCGEISAFYTGFEQFMEFYRSLGLFCSKSMWRKSVWSKMTNMRSVRHIFQSSSSLVTFKRYVRDLWE